jgi:hypothetical protein
LLVTVTWPSSRWETSRAEATNSILIKLVLGQTVLIGKKLQLQVRCFSFYVILTGFNNFTTVVLLKRQLWPKMIQLLKNHIHKWKEFGYLYYWTI